MSHEETNHTVEQEASTLPIFSKAGPAALLIGLILTLGGIGYGMLGGEALRKSFFQSYLFAFVFWATVILGCFGLMLLHHTVRGRWALPAIRVLEAGGGPKMMIVLALMFVPILAGMHDLYHWTHAEAVAKDPVLQHKQIYLNQGAFAIRTFIFIAIWFVFGWLLTRWSSREDATGDLTLRQRRTNWAAPGLLVLGLTVTFAFVDWVMSLDPHWYSTIYGAWFLVKMGLTGLALMGVYYAAADKTAPFAGVLDKDIKRDTGNMTIAFTLLWGYLSFSQFLIIWSGNLPEFIMYYVNRSQGGWNYLGGVLIVGLFFVPFLALLIPIIKRDAPKLGLIAAWILVMRVLDTYNDVVPFFRTSVTPQPLDIILLIGMGGLWFGFLSLFMRGSRLFPAYEPRLKGALEHA